MKQFIRHLIRVTILTWFDSLYLLMDKALIRRAYQLKLIPNIKHRTGGKIAYSEFNHTVGIFQTLIMQNLDTKENAHILDVGCGTGLLGISSFPLVIHGAKYLGIDVHKPSIDYGRSHYLNTGYEFQHLNARNAAYTMSQVETQVPWNIQDDSQELVTALSVWTHFNEKDAHFYLSEVARVLKPNCKAIITFFILDENYAKAIQKRTDSTSLYHGGLESKWIFDRPAYGSENWYHPAWTTVPEEAIGIRSEGLDSLLETSKLSLIKMYPGNWREQPGLFFQDILILQKVSTR